MSVAGIAAYLEGRWKDARELAPNAATLLRERCRAVAWELDNTHYYSLLSLFYLGNIQELETPCRPFSRRPWTAAISSPTSMRTRFSYLLRLAEDEPERHGKSFRRRSRLAGRNAFSSSTGTK